jgi:hypothetical protein
VSLGFTDMLYLPKRPIAKAFANASWQQQQRAIENILTLRKEGWRGVDLQPHLDAVTQVENVAVKCLKKGDWLLDHIEGELAFMRGANFRRCAAQRGAAPRTQMQRSACRIVGESLALVTHARDRRGQK